MDIKKVACLFNRLSPLFVKKRKITDGDSLHRVLFNLKKSEGMKDISLSFSFDS